MFEKGMYSSRSERKRIRNQLSGGGRCAFVGEEANGRRWRCAARNDSCGTRTEVNLDICGGLYSTERK